MRRRGEGAAFSVEDTDALAQGGWFRRRLWAAKGSDPASAKALSVRLVFVFIGAVFSCTLAGTNGAFIRIVMLSDHCSKALYRELKNESFEHTDEGQTRTS